MTVTKTKREYRLHVPGVIIKKKEVILDNSPEISLFMEQSWNKKHMVHALIVGVSGPLVCYLQLKSSSVV